MKVAVIGSRNCDCLSVDSVIENIPKECTCIVSGGARGVDQLAKQASVKLNIPIVEILPNYEDFGKYAPIVRNKEIVSCSDFVLAFWDYKSAGTKNALLEALKLDKKIKIIML